MNRMDVIARIAHPNAIALALMQVKRRRGGHLVRGIWCAVDRPLIESFERGILLLEEHLEHVIGWNGLVPRLAEPRIIPLERLRRKPLRLSFRSRVFDHGTHAVMAIVVCCVSHYPNARMIHLD